MLIVSEPGTSSEILGKLNLISSVIRPKEIYCRLAGRDGGVFRMYFHCITTICYLLVQARLSTFVVCLSPENIQELLDIHNYYREITSSEQSWYTVANMNQLEWDDRLATLASQSMTCQSARQRQLQLARDDFGLVNVGRTRVGNISEVVEEWFNERSRYLADEGECFPWISCTSYKTMINAKNRKIGCAARERCGRNWEYLVLRCFYEGGEPNQFDFQLGPPCTGCSEPLSFCRSNLCVSCDRNTQECDCKKSCIKSGIGLGELNSTTCTCTCYYGDGPNCDQPCRNREQYIDYDICSLISPEDCDDPSMGVHYRTFCAEVCSCRRPPSNAT